MKTKPILIGGLFLLGLLAGRYLLPSGSSEDSTEVAFSDAQATASIWTCSMHPQIQLPQQGDCPICGMDLIALTSEDESDDGPRTLSMSEHSRALAEIQTTEVLQAYPEAEVRLVGKLAYDETLEKSLAARFPVRIERLFVNYTGISVERGEHLAEVYSPELLTAQRELLTAYRNDPNGSLTETAREKLRLWDLLPEQIEAILERGEAEDRFTLRAPVSGVVVSKQIKEGTYVKTGEPLFKIVELSTLWAEFAAYESDLPWLRYGQTVRIRLEAAPGEIFDGRISFIQPEVDSVTRTVKVRVNVSNPERRLKSGMFVRGIVSARIGEDGRVQAPDLAGKWISPMHPEVVKDGPGSCDVCGMDLVPAETLGLSGLSNKDAPLIVPTSAVLRTGKRAVVYVEKTASERPTYEGREIVLGPRAGDYYLVASGLAAGERVVTNGAFKIDSALQIQAKPSMMSEASEKGDALRVLSPEETARLLPSYFELQAALASDDLSGAKAAINKLRANWEDAPDHLLVPMLEATTLDAARRPFFESISYIFIQGVAQSEYEAEGTIYLMHCPMVYPDRGADWLQNSDALKNPYFGSTMLQCGELKEKMN